MPDWTQKDLECWAKRIEKKVREFGLDCYPQEFEIVGSKGMRAYMSYLGLLPSYPHWSFGKAFNRLDTLYETGAFPFLAHEMCMNFNPSRALLLESNSLACQILVMAHVYGHNSFDKNNFMFRHTNPEGFEKEWRRLTEFIRELEREMPDERNKIEKTVTAGHALLNQRLTIPGTTGHGNGSNIIRFLIEECPRLEAWQKEILEILDRRWEYFFPQIETKIMSEGWTSYWHERISKGLNLPKNLYMEFLSLHSNIVFTVYPGDINPYTLGYLIFSGIKKRWDRMSQGKVLENEVWDGLTGDEKIFEVMKTCKDATSIERYLTREIVQEMYLVKAVVSTDKEELQIQEVGKEKNWESIKKELVRSVGMNQFPQARVTDKNWRGHGELYWLHEFDGRELDYEYTRKTLEHLYFLWQKPVRLETKKRPKSIAGSSYFGQLSGQIENLEALPYVFHFNGRDHASNFKPVSDSQTQKWLELLKSHGIGV